MRDWCAHVRSNLPLPGVRRRRADRIVEELASQLEEIHRCALERGASADEAEAEVARHVGDWGRMASDLAAVERPSREPTVRRWLDWADETARRGGPVGRLAADLVRDVRYGVRGLRRAPGFTATVVVVLALGIGAATAMLAVVDAILLEPLPYPQPERLVTLWTLDAAEGRSTTPLSGPNFADLRRRSSSFEDLGVQTLSWVNLSGGSAPTRVRACRCTAGLLRVLGVAPAMGRVFTDREAEDRERLVVVSDGLWRGQLGGDERILGGTLVINGDPHRVVGVMPPGFTTPRPWSTGDGAELWLPVTVTGDHAVRDHNWLFGLGRLAVGVTPEAAEAELAGIAAVLSAEHPDVNTGKSYWLMPLSERMVQGVRRPLLFLVGGAVLLLLIASTNAASIAFARATTRRMLTAIRASLGAARGRLARQLVTESVVLAAAGGLLGLLVAWWGAGTLRASIPSTVQRAEGIALDPSVLAVAAAATAVISVVIGVAVGLGSSGGDLASVARSSRRGQSRVRRYSRLHGAMVAAQFALTLLLSNGTALMLRSYLNAVHRPLAFDAARTLTAGVTLEGERYRDEATSRALWDGLVAGVRALPGVREVGLTSKLPLNGGTNGYVLVKGEEFDPAEDRPLVELSYSTAGYFAAMGIAVLEGRTFAPGDGDGEELGLIVNRSFAERYFPGRSALGEVIRESSSEPRWSGRVVGVVEDVPQWGLERTTLREVYLPFSTGAITSPSLVVGAAGSPEALVPPIREVLARLDPQVPLDSVKTMADVVAEVVEPRRTMTVAIAAFALLGLLLGGAGIYGVVSYRVSCHRHEIGIRMAIGAGSGTVVSMVLREGLTLAAAGVVVGLLGSVALARALAGLLYGVAPVDPASLAAVSLALTAVAALGTAVPALRAAGVDPVETLRAE